MPCTKSNLAKLFSVSLVLIIINFSSASAQETEEPEFSIKIYHGISLGLNNEELVYLNDYPHLLIA